MTGSEASRHHRRGGRKADCKGGSDQDIREQLLKKDWSWDPILRWAWCRSRMLGWVGDRTW